MKKIIVPKKNLNPPEKQEKTPRKSGKMNDLPPDTYEPEFEDSQVSVSESKLINFQVRRMGEMGLPCVDMRLFVETDEYAGPTKKGVQFPVDKLPDIILALQETLITCRELELTEE